MAQFLNNLFLILKEAYNAHRKRLLIALLVLLALEGPAIYYIFFYDSQYNVGLSGEEVSAFKQRQINLIKEEYQQKIAEVNNDILMQKMACSSSRSSNIISELESKKNQAIISIRADKSLTADQASQKIIENLASLNEEADKKIAVIQEQCAKEYGPKLEESLSNLEKEEAVAIREVKRNPVNIISGSVNLSSPTGQITGSVLDGSTKTEIISTEQALKTVELPVPAANVSLETIKQQAASNPDYQLVDFNSLPGQSGEGFPVY